MKKLLLNFWLLLLCMIVGGASSAWGTEITYTFTGASWTATSGGSSANWTSGKAGAGFANNGIQVTSNSSYTGANGTSPTSFSNISSIVLTYNTNKSAGSGTAVVKIGTNEETSQSWGYSGSSDGRTANFTLTYSYATPQTGNVKITLNTTTNSIYLVSCKITYSSSFSVTYAANGGTGTMTDSNSPYTAGDEVTLLSNTFTAPSGKQWSSWAVTDASSNAVTVTDGKFTMPSSNVTVTAQWEDLPASDYITVSPTTTNVVAAGDIPEFTITTDQTLDADPTQFYSTADADETASKPVWITEALYDEGTLLLTVAANTGAARTAYFRVEKGSVKSDVITITQDAKTYEIDQYTAPATAHGTITFSPESPVDAGAEVTLTATPASGYSFTADSWVFYKESAGDFVVDESISVTDNKFTMPAYDLYVDGTFAPIAVTGVTLSKTSITLGVGDTQTLVATVSPSNAKDKTVTWTSDNKSVATVNATTGVVTAVAVGSATITVTTLDGGKKATCAVTVANAVTFDATKDTGTSLSKNGVSFTTSATESSVFKFYKSSTSTFETTAGKITRIEFTGVSGYAISNMTASAGSLDTSSSPNGVWTGKVSSVTFTASTAQTRASKIKVFVDTTATPTFSVPAGAYSEAKSVEINCDTDGATIYYTTDGTTPTSSSTAYSSAIDITTTTTLKAIAIKSSVESSVASATYTMNRPDAPTFDPEEGIFNAAFTLHLSAADGATIYYTINGDTPTSSSTEYSDGVSISTATTTVKAIAVKSGLTSDVATATYTYDTRPAPTFTLSATALDLKVNETSSAVSLTTNSDGAVTFSCEDAHVTLTGTGTSRTISANAAGTYTVNVATAATSNYLAGAGTITVTVTKKATTMVLTPSFTSTDLYVTTSGSITGVPQYNSSDIDGAAVTYSSSDTKVATVASNGAITFKKAGSTTITASYAGNAEYEECEASYDLDLTDSTPQAAEVDIKFGNSLYGTSYTGTGAAGNGPFEGTVNNITVTVVQGSGDNLYVTNSETRIYGGTTKGTITIAAPAGYFITKIVFNDGTAPSKWDITASPGTLSTATWTGSASSVVFSASSRSDFTTAKVTIAPTVTITAADYATYCSPHDLDFSETDITVYKAKVDSEKKVVKLTAISDGIVPAGTGVILYKDVDAAATIAVPVTETDATITDNDLVGTTARVLVKKTEDDINYNYILQSGPVFNMAKAEGAYMPANRAYLSTTVVVSASSARLSVVFEDDQTTGIADVRSKKADVRGAIFDLQGRRVQNPKKGGLYIKNGKKVVVK